MAESTVEISDAELQEIYLFALDLGRRAGQILLDGVEKRTGEEQHKQEEQVEKINAVDIVTQTDLGELATDELTRSGELNDEKDLEVREG